MSLNRVSIILVNYNGARYNKECIDSILFSKYDDFEVIVVDNASTDNSVQELEDIYSDKITVIKSDTNLGFSGGNNIGISYALNKGTDFIMLLNNDTVIDSQMIGKMVSVSISKNNAVVSPKIYYYDNKKIIWSAGAVMNWRKGLAAQRGIDTIDEGLFDESLEVEFATGCCLLIPSEVVKEVGVLSDEYFLYYEDTDYCTRVINSGFKIIYEPTAVLYHKVSASTGGTESFNYIYYNTRNRLLFNHKFNSKNKLTYTSYFYFTRLAKIIIWAIKGKRELIAATVKAVRDYKNNNFGAIRR
ncbi:glycosyl transferase [Clostridium folliculivorans]|uniref:Glycosyl transferase n=1 Tax=Clostridium folliculivorans TaxID=2886038 RepID=A0A9W5Y603_9CLOT|nr:glycosyltransferase family 2 protein [Clostridium folliculivorans]GKU27283.1 glycosyl transferase [Clostridium folliculivorans]